MCISAYIWENTSWISFCLLATSDSSQCCAEYICLSSLPLSCVTSSPSGSWVLSRIHMLCSTTIATIMSQQRHGENCVVPPEKSRHRNLCFKRPNDLSMTFLVLVWLLLVIFFCCTRHSTKLVSSRPRDSSETFLAPGDRPNEFAKQKGLWWVPWSGWNEFRKTNHEQCIFTSNCQLYCQNKNYIFI